MIDRALLTVIRKIILQEVIFYGNYSGKIKDVDDPKKKGRVKVCVPAFGMSENDASLGFWCAARDKNALTTLKINDWVEVYFLNGDRDFPCCGGKINEIADMLPKNYDGNSKTHVLFEDPENKIHIKFDASGNILEIGNSDLQLAARLNDAILSDAGLDVPFWTYIASHVHPTAALGPPSPPTPPTPTSLTGKINGSSNQVKIGSK